MVGTGFLHRFRLGPLGEVRVGEALGEAVALLLGSEGGFRQAVPFRIHINEIGKRNVQPGVAVLGFDADSTFELQWLD